MSFCANCISGVTHEGTPIGKIEKIAGHDVYVTKPDKDYPKDKAVLFLPDVFGIHLVNCKLLADDFAKNGFQVYAPDYLNGDPVPEAIMGAPAFDIPSWLVNHGSEKTRPVLDDVIRALKEQGVTSFAATGYCFGGRYVFDLSFDNLIKVGATAHPSLLKIPEDLEKLLATSRTPLLINTCEVDQQYPLEMQAKGDEILGDGKYKPGYQKCYWAGVTHGFAVRGDVSNPTVKAAKEGAFKATVEFFIKYL
ncbi:alpha/beta-hydrolase [Ramaria rubella]|nr:alpha/beta-hydrolase [Ramaria rubella]